MLIGLGNPGERYRGTRHNVGALVVEEFVKKHKGVLTLKKTCNALAADLRLPPDLSVLAALPQTYMNDSGKSVSCLLKRVLGKLDPSALVVVHDELDLPVGEVRLKFGGGLAGHNGLRSIVEYLGSQDFSRVRVGVSRPERGGDMVKWVLSKPLPSEREQLSEGVAQAVGAIEMILADGLEKAMNAYNRNGRGPR